MPLAHRALGPTHPETLHAELYLAANRESQHQTADAEQRLRSIIAVAETDPHRLLPILRPSTMIGIKRPSPIASSWTASSPRPPTSGYTKRTQPCRIHPSTLAPSSNHHRPAARALVWTGRGMVYPSFRETLCRADTRARAVLIRDT